MRFGVLGTGTVGQTLGTKLMQLGHDVMLGARDTKNAKAQEWKEKSGLLARTGTYSEAAKFGDVLLNCTQGAGSLEALGMIERGDLKGKVLIDVANALDFSKGMPATLTICNTDSLGESIQREYPELRVVKALNTCNVMVMVEPSRVKGDHELFICGNDEPAKNTVKGLLHEFGWKSVIDLGDITNARATEQLLPIWLRLFGIYKTGDFNFHIAKN